MGRFNLIDEPWIKVIYSETGNCELVSLKSLFRNSKNIKGLAGDTKTQDFAVLRILLSVLHTVYSRFDADGNQYEMIELDDKFVPIEDVYEDDFTNYKRKLNNTWNMLWDRQSFTDSIDKYLLKWHDRFYLFDEIYPFMQVTKEDLSEEKINKKSPSIVMGKNLNRKLSESNNKISLFSPKYEHDKNKERLTEDEIIRWLITYHGYTGLADKVFFGENKYKPSKGWLFDIGGICLEGDNLFETLMMNFVLVHEDERYSCCRQKPCWEYSSAAMINIFLNHNFCDNIAQLYTTWSRAIYINPDIGSMDIFSCEVVKLPELEHKNSFLEPMTVWQFNEQGENKNTFTPKKHKPNEAAWRSFGIIAMPSIKSKHRKPGIVEWLNKKKKYIGNMEIGLIGIGMLDDGKSTSWLPIDEIYDSLRINDFILTDYEEGHWVPRINEAVENTKFMINKIYYNYLSNIADIRNIVDKTRVGFISREKEKIYFVIDGSFRNWISQISINDDKDKKIFEWYIKLDKILRHSAKLLLKNATNRDLIGIEKSGSIMNVVTAYNKLIMSIRRELNI